MMKQLKEWLYAAILLIVVFFLWFWFSFTKGFILIPVYAMSKIKDESIILGKRIDWGRWAYNMFISDDQATNAVLGGDRDITVSSRVGYNAKRGNGIALKMEVVIDWLFLKLKSQKDHCRASIERDEKHNKNWGG